MISPYTTFDNSSGWLGNALYVKSRPDRSAMILLALNDALRTRAHPV